MLLFKEPAWRRWANASHIFCIDQELHHRRLAGLEKEIHDRVAFEQRRIEIWEKEGHFSDRELLQSVLDRKANPETLKELRKMLESSISIQ